MKPTARKRLGKYVLLGRLGHGGMGKIYLAFAPGPVGIEKLLVIKRLHSHLTSDPVLVNSFLDEARLSMALTHPNIVHTYDVGEVSGRYFMVMEHIDGQNVGVLLRTAKRSGNYPDSKVWAGMYLGVLDGLHAAHNARDARGRQLSIIHRDVSPQNIIITYDGVPKLVDFGIAKAALRISETDAGVLKGKYSYMSPEQTQSQDLDPRSDVFAAGIVFWEMLAGRRLYKSDSVVKSVERILKEPPIPPLRVNTDCDPALSKVAVKALQKKREDRFSSAEEFRHAIDDALRSSDHYFRQSDLRDLMGELFADVRERQREVLDECLAGAALLDPKELETGTGTASKRDAQDPFEDGGSESDLEIPNLGLGYENETTTPSSALRSPLVTAEEEVAGDIPGVPSPADHNATRKERTPTPLPAEAAQAPTVAGPSLLPDPTVEVHDDAPAVWPRVAAALAAILIFGVLGVAWLMGAFRAQPTPSVVDVVTHTEELPARNAQAPGNTQPTPDGDAEPEPAAAADDDDDDDGTAAADDDGATDKAAREDTTREDTTREAKASAKSERRRRARAARSTRPRRERAPDPAPTPAPAAASPDKSAPAAKASARLTIETVPWTTVYLGTRKLGETPVIDVAIPAGEVTLTLVNPGQNIRQQYFLKAEPGKSYRKKLKLD